MTYESTSDVLTVDSRTGWLKRVFNFANIEFTFTKAYLHKVKDKPNYLSVHFKRVGHFLSYGSLFAWHF